MGVSTHAEVEATYSPLAKMFPENALLAFLLAGGNEDLWGFALLRTPGILRNCISLILRRLYSGILDSGVVCSNKYRAPVQELLKRSLMFFFVLMLTVSKLRKRRVMRLIRH